jgi:hypothetical protein
MPPADVVELRPDAAEYLAGLRRRGKWLLPVLVIFGARVVSGFFGTVADAVTGVAMLLALVAGVGSAVLHLRTSVMRLSPGRLEHDGAFVRRRSIDLNGARGLLAPMGEQLGAPVVEVLVVQSRRGETIRIAGGLWTRDDLRRIATHAGVPVESGVIGGKEFERRVPGSIPVRFRRPALFGLAVAVPTLAAVVLVVAAVYG